MISHTTSSTPIQKVLDRLPNARKVGPNRWVGRCPAHEDHQPSLSISVGKDHKALLICRAGCQTADVVAALDLTIGDLFPKIEPAAARGRTIEATYDYRDAENNLLFQVVRFEPKGFAQRRPVDDGWVWNLAGVEPVLYRLPELLAADPEEVVFVVEGEKDVDRLHALGFVVTTNPGGAGKWRTEYGEAFRGHSVAILFDNDQPGREHGSCVQSSLQGVAEQVRVVALPGLPPKGDVSDWLDAGGTAEQLRRLVEEPELKSGPNAAGDGPGTVVFPPPAEPMRVANRFVDEHFGGRAEGLILRHWRGEFWRWQTSHWLEVADGALQAEAYRYTENAVFERMTRDGPTLEPWAPNRYKIADLIDALRAVTHLSEKVDMPAWLDDRDHPEASHLVACANGLLDISTRTLHPHDRAFFNRVAVPFGYEANPPAPARWLAFLDELWPDDPEAIEALAEFMGYVISGRIDLHKILLLIGPTRAGKGVIARVLKALVGRGNYAGPTLASLGTNFGLSPLIGKPLAIISDARLGGANVHQVVERLLSVSGQDMLTVDVKYKVPWTGTLPTRFVVISNELPRFGDASGAIAGRFLVLTLRRSWLGHEDPALTDELLTELPGILSWVLDGLERLNARGRFIEPASSTDAIVALADLVSPTSAFVRERCEVDPGSQVPCDDLYAAWKSWGEDNGHRIGSSSSFGRDLRAVLPGLRTVRPRDDDRKRLYRGLRLSGDNNGPVHGPSWTRPPSELAQPAYGPLVQDGPRDQPLYSAAGEPRSTVHCDHYHAHQTVHRWAGDRWVCPECDPDEPEDLSYWLAAPPAQPDDAAPDEWGTIG